jgi:hypothetical protein
VPYSQISLTDPCDNNGVCNANPIYGEMNCPKRAVAYCKAQCDESSQCEGFFFQRHTNGHEICGFFAGDMHAGKWVHHAHDPVSQICEAVETPEPVASPEQPVQVLRATIRLEGAVGEDKSLHVAFRTVIAAAAGHLCGADGSEPCSPNDIVLTSMGGLDLSFEMHVANGQVATQAIANIQAQLEDGTALRAAMLAAGVTDTSSLPSIFFEDVQVGDPPAATTQPEAQPSDFMSNMAKEFTAGLDCIACPKFVGFVSCIAVLLLLVTFWAMAYCSGMRCSAPRAVAPEASEHSSTGPAVEAHDLEKQDLKLDGYSKVSVDETSKEQL